MVGPRPDWFDGVLRLDPSKPSSSAWPRQVRDVRRRMHGAPRGQERQDVLLLLLLHLPRRQAKRRQGQFTQAPYLNAVWLEDLVWTDVCRFLENPGEVLERVREQIGGANDGGEFEARREDLTKRLAGRQAEKDRYERTYAQGHISEEELEVYLADLKNQTDNLRLLLASVEAELSQKREQAELADTTEA